MLKLCGSTIVSSLSATNILADAIGARLPSWVLMAASYLPTSAFAVLWKTRFLAKQLGSRIIRDKMDAARKGLDIDNDIYGSLRELFSQDCALIKVMGSRRRPIGCKKQCNERGRDRRPDSVVSARRTRNGGMDVFLEK
jgi:hypothetical protein